MLILFNTVTDFILIKEFCNFSSELIKSNNVRRFKNQLKTDS